MKRMLDRSAGPLIGFNSIGTLTVDSISHYTIFQELTRWIILTFEYVIMDVKLPYNIILGRISLCYQPFTCEVPYNYPKPIFIFIN